MVYSSGSIQVSVDGVGIGGAGYGGSATTAAALASNMATVINRIPNSPVTATASGATVILTAKLKGVATDYSVSTSYVCNYPSCFQASVPAGYRLTGGTD
jgi:phage tail sheath gpL-like